MTYEEQYEKETGCHSRTVMIPEGYTANYVEWLENKLDIEHRRREAAEARFKTAEELYEGCINCSPHFRVSQYCKMCRLKSNWQQSIIDYNKIIKEAGE